MIDRKSLLSFIKNNRAILLVLSFFGILFYHLLSSHMLMPINGNLYSGGSTWADLAVHLTIITSLAERGVDAITQNPIYLGNRLTYPLIPDLISAVLFKVGLPLRQSLILPSFIGILICTFLIYKLSFEITKNKFTSLVVPFLFFFNGSLLGTYYFFKDMKESGLSFFNFLGKMDKEYAHLADYNIRFSNIIADYILPQRAIIMGLAIGILAIYFLWIYWERRDNSALYKSSLLTALLPLIHTHTFIAIAMTASLLGLIDVLQNRKNLRRTIKSWIAFFTIMVAIGLPQVLLISPEEKNSFFRFYLGWMRKEDESLINFWVNNLFPHIIVFALAFIVTPKKVKLFFLPFLAVFVLTNVIIFQPHNYDNMKIMLYPFLISCIMVVFLIDFIRDKLGKLAILIIFPLVLSMTLTGAISVYRESYVSWQMFSAEDLKLAEFVKNKTPKDAIFLTSDRHNNPVPCLTGRQILMGYRGWLWTYGIDYSSRERDINTMYFGTDASDGLIKRYGVDYALIESSQTPNNVNVPFFEKNYKKIFETENFKLYKII